MTSFRWRQSTGVPSPPHRACSSTRHLTKTVIVFKHQRSIEGDRLATCQDTIATDDDRTTVCLYVDLVISPLRHFRRQNSTQSESLDINKQLIGFSLDLRHGINIGMTSRQVICLSLH